MSGGLAPFEARPLAPTRTWNPVTGCSHKCSYCYAMRLIETKLKDTPKYRHGFNPTLHPNELAKPLGFRPTDVVFVVDMGDLFSDGVPDEWIVTVLEWARRSPARFLFLTKNPARYRRFLDLIPPRSVLGTTIETNRDDLTMSISRAPPPSERYTTLRDLPWSSKFVSIEPVMDFDLNLLTEWVREISPVTVHVGYDNWGSRLPEPPLWKVRELITRLSGFTKVTVGAIRRPWYERWARSRGL